MKVVKWILIVLAAIVGLLLIVGLFMPKKMEVTTSTEIELPVDQVFYSLATFKDRQLWDPWVETEPGAKVTITPKADYVGSEYLWDGEKLGQGKMVVNSVQFPNRIESSIWFKPDSDPSMVIWNLEETEGVCMTTWSLVSESSNPFMRLMNQMIKGMLVKSFDKGLSNLKNHLETNGVMRSTLSDITVKEFPPITAIIAEGEGNMENMAEIMGRLFGAVMEASTSQGIQADGPPFAYYYNYDEATGTTRIKAGIPIEGKAKDSGMVKVVNFKPFRGLSALHTGPYTEFENSYMLMMKELETRSLVPTMESWEFYYSDPGTEPDESKLKTEIVFVVDNE